MKKIFIISLSIVSLISCNKKNETIKEITPAQQETVQKVPEGKELLEKKCFLCHSPSAKFEEIVAPPMVAVKSMYLKDGMSREQFIQDFVNFSKNPTQEKAKLSHAVERFNLMPNLGFEDKMLTKIAEYVYDYQIQEPTWFKEHWKEKHGTATYHNAGKQLVEVEKEKTPAEIGMSYALGTKKVLGKNLMGTIQKKGTIEALQFCNHKAYPLTDSMANHFNATIKRVSDKTRNPANQPNEKELSIIKQYKKLLSEKAQLKPIVEEENGEIQFYAPIKTNTMCLQCHGTPNEQIKPATLKKLAELYPTDQAQGYKENQIRGIWSIRFQKK
ncbi:MAG: hypothetical protein CSA38_04070 [Flavobacteriales bacterium]|nr:MAG: hypothetical protein CSA38_04070 [Flavobacteriales bacterium]